MRASPCAAISVLGALFLLTACETETPECPCLYLGDASVDASVECDADAGDAGQQPADAGETGDAGQQPADAGETGDAGTAPADAAVPEGVVGPRLTDFEPSGPLTLGAGQEISGLHITSSDGPCVSVSGAGVRIHDCKIGPCGAGWTGTGITAWQVDDLRVDHNSFDDVASALYVQGEGETSDRVVFDHNLATRVRGPMPRGQLVQFDAVRGSGHRVVCNVSDQTSPGYLDGPEDHISMYASSGTPESPITIAFNKLRGGGPSRSGGGIMIGDNVSAYVEATDNVLVAPGQYGMAIAGGTNSRLLRNRIYSPVSHAWSNVGIYVWSQTEGAACSGHEVSGNRVFYVDMNGDPHGAWDGANCGSIAGWSENAWADTTLGPEIWDEVFEYCQ